MHWLAEMKLKDGREIKKKFPYRAKNYQEEEKEQYEAECWLTSQAKVSDVESYSVSFIDED